ncbi:hypothetical protein BDZ89DRAFT_105280 [Hymenopellis radicata]|nr:hypothetical protein BDZ89DRAFT_105280 [Hymenopellis radicata]
MLDACYKLSSCITRLNHLRDDLPPWNPHSSRYGFFVYVATLPWPGTRLYPVYSFFAHTLARIFPRLRPLFDVVMPPHRDRELIIVSAG